MTISINESQRLYIIQGAEFTSSIGFDNVKSNVVQMCDLMSVPKPIADLGSMAMYQSYLELLQRFKTHSASKKTWFQDGTAPAVMRVLKKAIASDEPSIIRMFFGNTETGYDWCEENDVTGFVGRTGGTYKSPLLMEPFSTPYGGLESANFGDAISCQNIVRMIDVLSGAELYRHPKYQVPRFQIVPANEFVRMAGMPISVLRDDMENMPGINVANFHDQYAAEDYVAFMKGQKVAMPFRTKHEAQRDLLESTAGAF